MVLYCQNLNVGPIGNEKEKNRKSHQPICSREAEQCIVKGALDLPTSMFNIQLCLEPGLFWISTRKTPSKPRNFLS